LCIAVYQALMWAAQRGHAKVVQCLLDVSADVNLQKPDGTTALGLALINKHDQVQILLLVFSLFITSIVL